MNDITKVPQPVSIQTGNGRVLRLREDKQTLDENSVLENTIIPPEPDYCNAEYLNPPPIDMYGGGWGELDSPVNQSTGVKFDPNSNMASMKQPKQYHIIDLFWLINPRFGDPELDQSQAHFCQISFNIDFGNLKITLNKIPNGAIHGHVMFLNSLKRLTSGTIYPGSCFKLIHTHNNLKENRSQFTCLEQLIQNSGEAWQRNRPMSQFTIEKDSIILTISDPFSGNHFYPFMDWQLDALLHAAEFATTKGYLLTGRINFNE